MSTVDTSSNVTLNWTDEQRFIIEATSNARLLVEAGPGTGKTAVACARVARLADQGINPTNILMFSFTRAAVGVLRDRIKSWSANPEVESVKIATLDSTAWFFRLGAGEEMETPGGSFDENIRKCIDLLKKQDPIIQEYLNQTQHIIVDETQDLTGLRSELVAQLLNHAPRSCGITVFGDPAQAIYGFTNDTQDNQEEQRTFLEEFPFDDVGFQRHSLTKIHRTNEPEILNLIANVRTEAYPGHSDASRRPMMVLETIEENGYETSCKFDEDCDLQDEDLVLSRKRAQAMHLAQFYPYPFRLRISNLPVCIHPWVGATLWNYTESALTESTFRELWNESVQQVVWDSISVDEAWAILDRHCGGYRNRVSLDYLRKILARPSPHSDFCLQDFGMWGPVFGTIHAAKGREADRVLLMLPRKYEHAVTEESEENSERKNAEEARVYYVGATRAKETFEFGTDNTLKGTGCSPSGRVFRRMYTNNNAPKCSVQIGQSGDIDDTALFRRDLCADRESAVRNIENLLRTNHQYLNEENQCLRVKAKLENVGNESSEEWRYRFFADVGADSLDDSIPIAWSSRGMGYDLFQVGNALQSMMSCGKLRPPTEFRYLKSIGLRTVAIDPQTKDADHLYEPFASSGLMLAPLIFGFPPVYFKYQRKR